MARIAYVDHSYHQKTRSTQFIPEILRRHGHTVDLFWDEYWKGGEEVSLDVVLGYDAIIMFQCRCSPHDRYYRLRHDNITHIPMLDQFAVYLGGMNSSIAYWEPFQGSKILSFSSAVHSIAASLGLRSLYVRYYQSSVPQTPIPQKGLHGFFWLRRTEQVSWPLLRKLIGETPFDSLHIHLAPDPGSPRPELPMETEIKAFNITTSTWFDKKEDFFAVLHRANVFFASRAEEGIGQSFLEAMARGQCVVACDNGTMNEYIVHGVNGLLYSVEEVAPLDFSLVGEMGRNALRSVEAGYARWLEQEKKIVEFILTPSPLLYRGYYRHAPLAHASSYGTDHTIHAIGVRCSLRQRLLEWRIIRRTQWLWRPVWCLIKPFIVKKKWL
jgi:Glycosyltransferase